MGFFQIPAEVEHYALRIYLFEYLHMLRLWRIGGTQEHYDEAVYADTYRVEE